MTSKALKLTSLFVAASGIAAGAVYYFMAGSKATVAAKPNGAPVKIVYSVPPQALARSVAAARTNLERVSKSCAGEDTQAVFDNVAQIINEHDLKNKDDVTSTNNLFVAESIANAKVIALPFSKIDVPDADKKRWRELEIIGAYVPAPADADYRGTLRMNLPLTRYNTNQQAILVKLAEAQFNTKGETVLVTRTGVSIGSLSATYNDTLSGYQYVDKMGAREFVALLPMAPIGPCAKLAN